MKITFIGHASILIETRGLRILSDPWWKGPCFGAQWWIYPLPYLEPTKQKIDYIYISHGHHDHLHPATLRTLNKDAKVLVSKNIDIADSICELGFETILIDDNEEYALSPNVKCRLIETHNQDTLFAVSDDSSVCINLNDALHAAPSEIQKHFFAILKSFYPKIDYLFCGYGVASHFPNCYHIPHKDSIATAINRQAYFNRCWVDIVDKLSPRFAFPFAADVAFLEYDLQWAVEPTHNAERPTDIFKQLYPNSITKVFDIAPGFEIRNTEITSPIFRKPTTLTQLRVDHADNIQRANEYGACSEAMFNEVLQLIRDNAAKCDSYIQEFSNNYRFLLRFRNYNQSIVISKKGKHIDIGSVITSADDIKDYDVVYITRLQYIRWSLSSKYGHEILFVGSGGIFEYFSKQKAEKNIHRELMIFLVPHLTPPQSRFGDQPEWLYHIKQSIRNLTKNNKPDLYDLGTWTIWEDVSKSC